jgi:mannitol/fructose-specific phosphotransferase system IIA component (Ntr-type)
MGITTIVPAVPQRALCIPELGPRKRDSALQFMLAHARAAGALRDVDSVHDALLLRERLASTAVGKAVAVPNARALAVLDTRWILARSDRGIDWNGPDGIPVRLILLVLSTAESPVIAHVESVARAMTLTRLARARARLLEARGAEEMAAIIQQALP